MLKISHFPLLTVSVSVLLSHLSQYIQSSSSSFECSKKVFRLFSYRVRKINHAVLGGSYCLTWLTLTLHMVVFIPYHTYHFQHRWTAALRWRYWFLWFHCHICHILLYCSFSLQRPWRNALCCHRLILNVIAWPLLINDNRDLFTISCFSLALKQTFKCFIP